MRLLTTTALVIGGFLSFAATMAPASASTVYDWTLSGGDLAATGSGSITVSDTAVQYAGSTGETITAISGTIDGSAITGLTTVGDNILYPYNFGSDGFGSLKGMLDASGLSFMTAAGQTFNIFFAGMAGYDEEGSVPFGQGTFTVTEVSPTPLPPTWTMMLGALLGLGFIFYRGGSRRTTAVTA
jgi:hypothetical protein